MLYLKFYQTSVGLVNVFVNVSTGKFHRKTIFKLNLARRSIMTVTVKGENIWQNIQDEESPRNIMGFLLFTVELILTDTKTSKFYWFISILLLSLMKLYFMWLDCR